MGLHLDWHKEWPQKYAKRGIWCQCNNIYKAEKLHLTLGRSFPIGILRISTIISLSNLSTCHALPTKAFTLVFFLFTIPKIRFPAIFKFSLTQFRSYFKYHLIKVYGLPQKIPQFQVLMAQGISTHLAQS